MFLKKGQKITVRLTVKLSVVFNQQPKKHSFNTKLEKHPDINRLSTVHQSNIPLLN